MMKKQIISDFSFNHQRQSNAFRKDFAWLVQAGDLLSKWDFLADEKWMKVTIFYSIIMISCLKISHFIKHSPFHLTGFKYDTEIQKEDIASKIWFFKKEWTHFLLSPNEKNSPIPSPMLFVFLLFVSASNIS
jgi:hypothetical protein